MQQNKTLKLVSVNEDNKNNDPIDFRNINTHVFTKENILSIVSEEDIMRHYLGEKFKWKHPICSPLRNDTNPSFSIYRSFRGTVKWYDFGRGESGDCFDFVQKLLGVDYKTALRIIYADLIKEKHSKIAGPIMHDQRSINHSELNIPLKNEILPENVKIVVESQPFTHTDVAYWSNYYLKISDIAPFGVMSAKKVWIGMAKFSIEYVNTNPMYAYEFIHPMEKRYKIYRPYSTDSHLKWRSNTTVWDIYGYTQLAKSGNLLIITKSLKDVMVLHKMGFNAVAPQSENSGIPEILMNRLKARFQEIVIFYDNDEAGIKGAINMCDKYRLSSITFPARSPYKDIAEMTRAKGPTIACEFVIQALESVVKGTKNLGSYFTRNA